MGHTPGQPFRLESARHHPLLTSDIRTLWKQPSRPVKSTGCPVPQGDFPERRLLCARPTTTAQGRQVYRQHPFGGPRKRGFFSRGPTNASLIARSEIGAAHKGITDPKGASGIAHKRPLVQSRQIDQRTRKKRGEQAPLRSHRPAALRWRVGVGHRPPSCFGLRECPPSLASSARRRRGREGSCKPAPPRRYRYPISAPALSGSVSAGRVRPNKVRPR
jgi:hypothetical protein